jgi:hypothetical protein
MMLTLKAFNKPRQWLLLYMKRLQRMNHIAHHFPACYAGLGYPTPSASPGQAIFDNRS